MQRHLDQNLNILRTRLSCMSEMVENAIQRATDALFEENAEKAKLVKRNDYDIDMLEIDIDELLHQLIVLNQPAAVDLRFITMSMKVTNVLERMGDHASNIAGRALALSKEPYYHSSPLLLKLVNAVRIMVGEAVQAFTHGDIDLARKVLTSDDNVDNLNRDIYNETKMDMETHPYRVGAGLHVILIATNLERIADLATNIAEDVIFAKQGKEIRHQTRD